MVRAHTGRIMVVRRVPARECKYNKNKSLYVILCGMFSANCSVPSLFNAVNSPFWGVTLNQEKESWQRPMSSR
jgi:hypothetical protein